jgi:pantoate--beta-alanine ligase
MVAEWGTIEEARAGIQSLRKAGKTVGFVPTMGYLHAGHISLVHLARKEVDEVIVSIFVNPSQFNDPKDLEVYPRDLPRDLALLKEAGAKALFLPTPALMYTPSFESWVSLENLPLLHEGPLRPGHFRGVATVVTMLFNIIQPDLAVFGEKDFQQLRIIERMVADLKMPIKIVRGPIVREGDGLAMSSRNVRLVPAARARAAAISAGLREARAVYEGGERNAKKLCDVVTKHLSIPDVEIEYINLVNEETLQCIETVTPPARILAVAKIGGVRLLDNMALSMDRHAPRGSSN